MVNFKLIQCINIYCLFVFLLFVYRNILHFAVHWFLCESRPAYSFIRHPTTRGTQRTTKNDFGLNLFTHSQTVMYFFYSRSWLRTQLQSVWMEWCTSGSVTPSPLWPTCVMLTSPPVCWLKPPSEMSWELRTWLSSCLTVKASLTACRYRRLSCGNRYQIWSLFIGVYWFLSKEGTASFSKIVKYIWFSLIFFSLIDSQCYGIINESTVL